MGQNSFTAEGDLPADFAGSQADGLIVDEKQRVFEGFAVPDPQRIRKVANFLRGYFGNIEGKQILECGVAINGLSDMLRKEGAICYGVDLNPRFLSGVKILQADLNNGLPKFGCDFDVIFAGELMEHLYDENKFLLSCRENLSSRGILALTVPNLVFLVNRFRMFFGQMPLFAYKPYHYHIYNYRTLRDLLEAADFEVLAVKSSHVLFSTRRHPVGRVFEKLGDVFPSMGAHLIVFARKN